MGHTASIVEGRYRLGAVTAVTRDVVVYVADDVATGRQISVEVLRALCEIGVGISIDDFGMGYSSLNYLKRFPITAVKIDRAFVNDLTANDGDAAIVSAVISMARSLRLRVVAEGVETAEQFAFLRSKECDEAQGFYFSRPMMTDDVTRVLIDRRALAVREPRLAM